MDETKIKTKLNIFKYNPWSKSFDISKLIQLFQSQINVDIRKCQKKFNATQAYKKVL